jgi:hypothetical protein
MSRPRRQMRVSLDFYESFLERAKGFEPSTPTLARLCSTPELHPHRCPPGWLYRWLACMAQTVLECNKMMERGKSFPAARDQSLPSVTQSPRDRKGLPLISGAPRGAIVTLRLASHGILLSAHGAIGHRRCLAILARTADDRDLVDEALDQDVAKTISRRHGISVHAIANEHGRGDLARALVARLEGRLDDTGLYSAPPLRKRQAPDGDRNRGSQLSRWRDDSRTACPRAAHNSPPTPTSGFVTLRRWSRSRWATCMSPAAWKGRTQPTTETSLNGVAGRKLRQRRRAIWLEAVWV